MTHIKEWVKVMDSVENSYFGQSEVIQGFLCHFEGNKSDFLKFLVQL